MLQQTFSERYPSTKTAKVVCDQNTGQSRGYGFVRFYMESERNAAMNEMQGQYCGSRPMRINAATPKSQQAQLATAAQQQIYAGFGNATGGYGSSYQGYQAGQAGYAPSASPAPGSSTQIDPNDPNNTTLFIGGLDINVDEMGLRQAFQPYGELLYVRVPPGKNCGFVQFSTRKSAEDALNNMNQQFIGNQRVRISWGRSSPGGVARPAAAPTPATPAAAPTPTPATEAEQPAAAEGYAGYDYSAYYAAQQTAAAPAAAPTAPSDPLAAPAQTAVTRMETETRVSDLMEDFSKPYDIAAANDSFLCRRYNTSGAPMLSSELYASLDGMVEE
jgi:RNA recognition motif-containing protein